MNTTPKTNRSTSDTLSLPALKGEVSRAKSIKKSIDTVNFVSIRNDSGQAQLDEIISFPDTEEGNKEVEAIFVERIRKNNSHFEQDIPSYIEDGFYACPNGMEYSISHSTY